MLMSEELNSRFFYSTKYTMKKLIDEFEFKIQFQKKLIIGSEIKYIEIVGFFFFGTEMIGCNFM